MKNATQEITLYNFFLDTQTGYDACHRVFIQGVSVFNQTAVSVDKDGMSAADAATIRIPEKSTAFSFFPPLEFSKALDKSDKFTLAKGDVIVLGKANESAPRRGELEERYGRERVLTVVGVTDNRFKREPHWKVICK